MKIFKTIVENGNGTYIDCHGTAKNAKEFTEMYGKGVTKPEDVTKEYFVSPRETTLSDNSCTRLIDDLIRAGWGTIEAQFVADLLDAELEKQGR